MLILTVLLLLFFAVLAVLLTAWSLWFQGFLYTEPSQGLVWRGPAAAGAISFVALIWVVADYRSQGRYRPIWESTSTEVAKTYKELRVPGEAGGKEEVYLLRPGTANDYRLNGSPTGKRLPATPPKVTAIDGDEKVVFEPERDAKGNFKRPKSGNTEEPLRYLDDRGRVMREGSLGRIDVFRGGVFVGNVLINLAFVAACFLSLWLLVRFQWWHALLHAVALALLLMLFVLPPLLSKAESVAKQRSAAAAALSPLAPVWRA